MNRKRTVIRQIFLVACILFIAGLLLSEAFLITHIDHEHDHAGPQGTCTACVLLAAVEGALKHVSAALIGLLLAFGCFSAAHSTIKTNALFAGSYTPVFMKVKLNN